MNFLDKPFHVIFQQFLNRNPLSNYILLPNIIPVYLIQ